MTEDVRRQECARGEGDEADDDPAFAAGGHIQHGYEHGEEHQRGAQIVLNHEHAHGHDPHHDDRAHILDPRQLQAEYLLAADRKLVAVVEQFGADHRQHRGQQQHQADHHAHV